ncbi:hypothetical protein D3C81_1387830 [compost metagenome]
MTGFRKFKRKTVLGFSAHALQLAYNLHMGEGFSGVLSRRYLRGSVFLDKSDQDVRVFGARG